jgi:histidyl-tRNA synthetase
MSKPSLPQGTRDFSAQELRKRQYIFQTIRLAFEQYGFEPLETPAMENLDTLMGKYGEEGDKLIFKILNNGLDRPEKQDKARADFEKVLAGKNVKEITERALRYDLTIPFARYVAMNHGQLTLPFRRYQMQPVWRADRPQRGRYREFYQCDADVVGSKSLLVDTELAALYATVFSRLNLPVEIRINNRKILAALAEACGGQDKLTDITVSIDKLDKIGPDKVKAELLQRGLTLEQVGIIEQYLALEGSTNERIEKLKSLIGHTDTGAQGIAELEYVLQNAWLPLPTIALVPDFTLARGLNYYTGTIFEVKAVGVQMGSIGGGGRYDNLTGLFGVPDIAGVGISFGVDRICDVLEELGLFPESLRSGTQVLFFNLGQSEAKAAFKLLQALRQRGITGEIFHEAAKFDKQFKYAEKKQIAYAIIIGATELQEGTCLVKHLATGTQHTLQQATLADTWTPG